MKKPILGISMGDPFGNGPEITVKALSDKTVYDRCRPLVVGDVSSMEYAARVARKVSGIDVQVRAVHAVSEARFEYGVTSRMLFTSSRVTSIPEATSASRSSFGTPNSVRLVGMSRCFTIPSSLAMTAALLSSTVTAPPRMQRS